MEFSDLQYKCGLNAATKGWHDRYHELNIFADDTSMTEHLVTKTALIGSEVAEAIEELRKGHGPNEVYEGENGKPEGFPVELADVVIRAVDLAYTLEIDLEQIIHDKLAFNKTRERLHGKKV